MKTVYESKTLRLPGMGHCGGLVEITEDAAGATVDQMQMLSAMSGTAWQHVVQRIDEPLWSAHKHLLLAGLVKVA